MNSAFVVTAYCTKSNRCILDCVESIVKSNPGSRIIIIDSNSPDKTYFDIAKSLGAEICDVSNKHRETGSIWYAYKNYSEVDFFYFLQDSLLCLDNVEHLSKKEFSCLRYFPSWDGKKFKGTPGLLGSRCGWADSDVPKEKNGLGFKYKSENGMDDRNWLQENLIKYCPEIKIPHEWYSIFGPVFFCRRSTLEKIYNTGFSNILPVNKLESCTMERAWGIIFKHFGHCVYSESIQKYYLHPSYRDEYLFKKNFYLR